MDWYSFIKTIHIISSTVLFGTGIGTAFFMLQANLKGDIAAKVYATRTTVIADFLFTTPAGIIQPLSGFILISIQGYNLFEPWLVLTYILYFIAFAYWLPVVWIQIKLRNIALETSISGGSLPGNYYKLAKIWFILGWPAFISLSGIFFLMVYKPSLW
jgi:uncharacterized membrane protein